MSLLPHSVFAHFTKGVEKNALNYTPSISCDFDADEMTIYTPLPQRESTIHWRLELITLQKNSDDPNDFPSIFLEVD